MKKSLLLIAFLLLYYNSQSQCNSKGIMGACSSLDVIDVPAFDVSVGYSSLNIVKFDVNYITKSSIVYGGSFGFRTNKLPTNDPENITLNAFLGYNCWDYAIVGVTGGITHFTDYYYITPDSGIKSFKSGIKPSIGMSVKFIPKFSKTHFTFGGFGGNSGIGLSLGIII